MERLVVDPLVTGTLVAPLVDLSIEQSKLPVHIVLYSSRRS